MAFFGNKNRFGAYQPLKDIMKDKDYYKTDIKKDNALAEQEHYINKSWETFLNEGLENVD